MRYEFPQALDADSASLRHDDDYLFAGAPNVDDSFVKARGIAIQRTTTLFAIRKGGERVGSWKRWKPLGKKGRAKTTRKRQNGGWRGATAIARTHERKATRWNSQVIHSACQRGFPCGKRYRRGTEEKEKAVLGRRERRKGRVGAGGEKEGRAVVEMAVERGRTKLRDIGRGEVFATGKVESKENCQQSSDCIVAPKGKVHRPLENLLTYGNRARARALVVHASVCRAMKYRYCTEQRSALLRQ